MNWLIRIASDSKRIARNIERLKELGHIVHDLAFFGVASQSGGFNALKNLLTHRIVLGRPKVFQKLKQALIGENNQKVVLDAPMRFQALLLEAQSLIENEIKHEQRTLQNLR